MPNVIVDKSKIDLLANAIADKSGEPVTMTLDEMVEAVDGIETGGGGITPTGNINITQAGVTDVTNYATATVPTADANASTLSAAYITENGNRKWRIIYSAYAESAGWVDDGSVGNGHEYKYSAIASGKSVTPTESAQTIGGANTMMEGAVTVNAIPSNYVGSGVTQRASSDLSASGATVTAPSGYYENNATKTISSGSVTAPTTISGSQATLSTGTNTITLQKTLSVTPNVTTAGYISSGTAGNALVSLNANVTTKAAATFYPSSSDQSIASGTYLTGAQTIKGVTTTNLTAANIKSGVVVQVGDSTDADRVLSVTGTYEGSGGGDVETDTKTATASNYPTSLSFTGMKGEPKMFTVRLNTSVSSSGSTTYYYIVDITSHGTTTHGNCFRIGSTRQVTSVTSGYSWSYSGTTLTITSSAASRSSSPGAFYSGSYELMYVY